MAHHWGHDDKPLAVGDSIYGNWKGYHVNLHIVAVYPDGGFRATRTIKRSGWESNPRRYDLVEYPNGQKDYVMRNR